MAFELSATADLLSKQTNINQQIILHIDGLPLFGAITITKLARFGDEIYFGDAGLVFGGVIPEEDQLTVIDLKGTTQNITQQIFQDKGGTTSISKVTISLVDKNQEVTRLLSPSFMIDDALGREADVYLAFQGGSHPEDSIKIFNGTVDELNMGQGSIKVSIASPEQLKRRELFLQVNTKLDFAINNSSLTIPIESAAGFILPQDSIESYLKINNEIIKIDSISGNIATASARGQLNTFADSHDSGDDVTSFYRISGNAIDLCLKLLLSTRGYFSEDTAVISFAETGANRIEFKSYDIQKENGLSVGDIVNCYGSVNPSNVFEAVIMDFGITPTGSYIEVDVPITFELSETFCKFKSKFDVLSEGCAMSPRQVDVDEFIKLKVLLSSSIPNYDFYIKETLDTKDFIDNQVLFPAGLRPLPRKGKVSVGATLPPLVAFETKELNTKNIKNAKNLQIMRSVNKNFYNHVIYKYDEDSLEDKFKQGTIYQSADSLNRIKNQGNKPLTIVSKGLRDNPETTSIVDLNSRRLLDRYQFASESIKVQTFYKVGFNIEVGDTVIFGDPDLQVSDINEGNRDFQPRLMECVNRSMNIVNGDISLDLLDTAFALTGRYGVISPSSLIDSDSTAETLFLKNSFSHNILELTKEIQKWEQYIGEAIVVRDANWTDIQYGVITGIDEINDALFVEGIVSPPNENYIIDLHDYNSQSTKMKRIHVFFNPQLIVMSGISNTEFEVNDASDLFIGSVVIVNSPDYLVKSIETTVESIMENIVTVADPLGFVPLTDYEVNLIGHKIDESVPYRYV